MEKCEYCKDFNKEEKEMEITDIRIGGVFYNYECPLKHCPNCGKILKNIKSKHND